MENKPKDLINEKINEDKKTENIIDIYNDNDDNDDINNIFIHEVGVCFTNALSTVLKKTFKNSDIFTGQYDAEYLKKELIDKVIKKPTINFVLIDSSVFYSRDDIVDVMSFLSKESDCRIIYLDTEEDPMIFGKLVAYGIYDIIVLNIYGDKKRSEVERDIKIDIIHQFNNKKSLRDVAHFLDDFTNRSVVLENEANKRFYKTSSLNIGIYIDHTDISMKIHQLFKKDTSHSFNIKVVSSFSDLTSNDILLENCDIIILYNPDIIKLHEIYSDIRGVDKSVRIIVLYQNNDYKKLIHYDISFMDINKYPLEQFIDILKTHISNIKQSYEDNTLIFKNKVITVTSKSGGVGVSTIAKELGGLFSHANQKIKTCVVDFNLSASSMTPLYGNEKSPNLYDLLIDILSQIENGVSYKAIKYSHLQMIDRLQYDKDKKLYLLPTGHQNFHILTEGRYENNSILAEALQVVIENLREHFDVVIIDTKGLTDGTVIALEFATDIFLVTTDDYSSIYLNKYFLDDLKTLGIDTNKIKIILNKHQEYDKNITLDIFNHQFKDYVTYKINYNKKIGISNLKMKLYTNSWDQNKQITNQFIKIINDMVMLYPKKIRRKKIKKRQKEIIYGKSNKKWENILKKVGIKSE